MAVLRKDDRVTGLTDGIAAVVFDFYGTLTPISPNEAWASNAAQLAAIFGVSASALAAEFEATFPARITGAMGGVRQTMQALAARLGVQLSDDELKAASALRRQVQESMFELRPEALPVIGALRERGLKIGLLSDCTAELPDAWSRLPLSAVVDVPVFSCKEGTGKPDPRLFRTVAAGLRTEPARCLYVGDGGGRELTGASAVGMRAVLLAGSDWHLHRTRDREDGWTGPRIGSLTDLLPMRPADAVQPG